MNKKKITVISINFYPEETSTGLYTSLMVHHLAKYFDVDVITGVPFYPDWKISDDYKSKPKYNVEKKDNMTFYRYKHYVPDNPTFVKRIIQIIDFFFGSLWNLRKVKKSDLIISIVPPTSQVVHGLLLKKKCNSKLWVHIQDFEFDMAIESGLAGEQKGIKSKIFELLFSLESTLLNRADIVSTISFGMLSKLKEKTNSKSYFFPNWVDESFIDPNKAKSHEYMRKGVFKVLYSGNVGAKQDWEYFIKVVKFFKNNKDIEFIVIGAGAKKDWLLSELENLTNVKHYNPIKYEELPNLLCNADLHILFQKNNVVDTVMPSKLLGMMASQIPSLVTGNKESEIAKVFEKSKGGYFFDSNCFSEVTDAIRGMSKNKDICKQMGINARSYIVKEFSSNVVLPAFVEKVNSVIDQ
ncbi:WcaI family glycosyltransferase [Labilibacter marinus]|uniref:WcaI family glycosyltransferase n=1 Tax=Labilibacter marinus TaxID=1477105 RepID=UPI0009501C1C|nr:WcaI family glycosyltransferase [Labilibacter marinus]